LTDQKFETDDMNVRATWRALSTLTLITRYDFQLSTVDTKGAFLNEIQSAEITSHIISESISWTPLNRLYLQASASYALDSTATISREISKAVRVSLKYGFFRNREKTYGGHNDYDAHLVFATMQYRF